MALVTGSAFSGPTNGEEPMIQGVIARRRYDRADGRGHVEVAFFQPERDGETGDFRCPFEISGLEGIGPIRREAWGVDSVQALQQAMQGARVALEPHRAQLRWLGDSELGFAQYVPNGFGPELEAHFEQLIEREMLRLSQLWGVEQDARIRAAGGTPPPGKKRQWTREDALSDLEWLEQWYESQCREEWAHHQGVSIQSLDNPGWLLEVDLRGTNLEGRMADAVIQRTGEPPSESNGNQGGDDWMDCSIKEGRFIGAGDPRKFRAILNCFRVWARIHDNRSN